MDANTFRLRMSKHLAPFSARVVLGCCCLDPSMAARTTRELEAGRVKKNSDPFTGTKYHHSALLGVKEHDVGVCHPNLVGSMIASFTGRPTRLGPLGCTMNKSLCCAS